MLHDKRLIIAHVSTRKSVDCANKILSWSDFVKSFEMPAKSQETLKEYNKLPKNAQAKLKDVGGFIGGKTTGKRHKNDILDRCLITLDLDNIDGSKNEAKNIELNLQLLNCSYMMYSTRKHTSLYPRLRLIFPTDRIMSAEEYEPTARKLAELMGFKHCDPSTFQINRLMYYPSICADGEYVYQVEDKGFISVDALLKKYKNWKNISEWKGIEHCAIVENTIKKQQCPLTKKGIIGAFCKAYSIPEAIETFIPEAYAPCDSSTHSNRYTYTAGTTYAGAIMYEDKFLYSHHATDPCSQVLVNAFDLIRIHKFRDLDSEAKEDTPTHKLPSFGAMSELAMEQDAVKKIINAERLQQIKEDFGDNTTEDIDSDWMDELSVNPKTLEIHKTIENVKIILNNDPNLKGKIKYDGFIEDVVLRGKLPWFKPTEEQTLTDTDLAGTRWYLEKIYKITGKNIIIDALILVAMDNYFNELQQYLNKLKWDKIERIDTLFIDYLGAEDTLYNRQTIRKMLLGAVARAFTPGAKFDNMCILSGKQGIGKSTFISILGGNWYSDSLCEFEGLKAYESIRGRWILEVGELAGMSRAKIASVKHFLTKTEDSYRAAYARCVKHVKRNCVFFGTTNESQFLQDMTGNRRFWAVYVGVNSPTKNIFTDLIEERDQIWAEAVQMWKNGNSLLLDAEVLKMAEEQQEQCLEHDERTGIIEEFIDTPVPIDWNKRTIDEKLLYLNDPISNAQPTELREKISAIEIWVECLRKNKADFNKRESRQINNILNYIKNVQKLQKVYKIREYGAVRGWEVLKKTGN